MKIHKNSFAITLIASLMLTATHAEEKLFTLYKAQKPIINSRGEYRYSVQLSPFYTDSLKEKAGKAGYALADVHNVKPGDPTLELPEVRFAADIASSLIGRKPEQVRSWVATEFEIYATPSDLEKIFRAEGVISISELEGKEANIVLSQSTTTAIGDTISGSEVVPWWLSYTNTLGNYAPPSNAARLYTIEGPLMSPISQDIVIGSNQSASSSPDIWQYWHSAHVTGVIGAKQNNMLSRGVNPGQPISHKGYGIQDTQVVNALNEIVSYSDVAKDWGVISMSLNNGAIQYPGNNTHEFSHARGRAMAIASNYHLILQSAGNNNSDKCGWGYTFNDTALPWDAIMLVGGHDRMGNSSVNDPAYFHYTTPPTVITTEGSNYGPCVEIWAPSQQITSLRYNSSQTQVLSGTSFSAPIAAAIASRHGDYSTRPLQREWFLKKNGQYTGKYALDGSAIYSAKWNSSPNSLKRHNIQSAWSPQTNSGISNLYNGSYNDMWNAGAATGTVVLDLGTAKNVKFLRVTPRSSVKIHEEFKIEFSVQSSTNSTGSVIGTYQDFMVPKHGDRAPITLALSNDMNTRYVVLHAGNYGSWLAYSEIEVYGQ